MPVDRYHAFGEGLSYNEPSKLRSKTFKFVKKAFGEAIVPLRDRVWRQFSEKSVLQGKNRLGTRAWCINHSGRHDAIVIGERTIVRGLLRVEKFGNGKIEIGPEVYIGDDCLLSCSESIKIGRGTLLAHGVQVFDNNSHPRRAEQRSLHWRKILGDRVTLGDLHEQIDHAPIQIGENAWLGLNTIVMRGVTIGDRSIIAPGSVVTKSIPADVVAAGNPAKVISSLAEAQNPREQLNAE